MLKILSHAKNLLLPLRNAVSQKNAAPRREFAQFGRRSWWEIKPTERVKSTMRMKGALGDKAQMRAIAWGLSGIAILGSVVFVDKSCALLVVLPLGLLHHEKMVTIFKMLPRDLLFIKRFAHAKFLSNKIMTSNWTLHKLFHKTNLENSNKVMISMDGQDWKYKEINSYANRVSRLFQRNKLTKGDVVALVMENSPEMLAIIIGLSQIGVIGALVNFHLKSHGLKHCIEISKCSCLIADKDHTQRLDEIKHLLDPTIKYYQFDGNPRSSHYRNFHEELYKEKDEAPEVILKPSYDDPLVYIYTSGTSGVPKAAFIPHSKFLVNNVCGATLLGLNKSDKVYNPLPLYHSTGLTVGAASAITGGVPVVIRKKFSSHNYIPDCIKYNCTVGTYIGEICRYIYLVPPASSDRKHRIRFMVGNGLNIDLWKRFQERFGIKMTELYGSTEGNCNMINIDGKQGAVGFLPLIAPFFLYPYYLVKTDLETSEIKRGPNGLCIKCEYGEPGMLVGRIKKVPESEYYGYVNKEADTKAKILRDVFKKGDSAFISGDILTMDKYQYFYFKDRTGDTFRWKGENVSSTEVEGIVMGLLHKSCACFGIKLKGYDGYAGMLCIEDPDRSVDLVRLMKDFMHHLPRYSIPRFVRIVDKIEMTSTHKIVKRKLARQSINLDVIKDEVYYFDKDSQNHKRLTKEILKDIDNMKVIIT